MYCVCAGFEPAGREPNISISLYMYIMYIMYKYCVSAGFEPAGREPPPPLHVPPEPRPPLDPGRRRRRRRRPAAQVTPKYI